jgi:hypothetical protein
MSENNFDEQNAVQGSGRPRRRFWSTRTVLKSLVLRWFGLVSAVLVLILVSFPYLIFRLLHDSPIDVVLDRFVKNVLGIDLPSSGIERGLIVIVPTMLIYGLFFGLAVALGKSSRRAFFRGKSMVAASAAEVMARDPRPPVLYLRSFTADDLASAAMGQYGALVALLNTEEETLAQVLAEIGPVIAIGRPEEELPHIGAARLYVSHDLWQDEVLRLMSRAGLVVLRAGDSAGLWWEVERATQLMPPERILFLLSSDQQQYDLFRAKVHNYLPCCLPDLSLDRKMLQLGTIGAILYFNSDWTPHLINFKRVSFLELRRITIRRPLVPMCESALRPVLEQLKQLEQLQIPWKPPRPPRLSRAIPIPVMIVLILLLGWIPLLSIILFFKLASALVSALAECIPLIPGAMHEVIEVLRHEAIEVLRRF